MSPKKSFFVLLRIVFVVMSFQFFWKAFYYWDGYSFYMQFTDFLPDISLMYILWSILWIIFAVILWLVVCGFFTIIKRHLKTAGFEHIITWIILCVLILAVKKIFFKSVSLTKLFGLNHLAILIIGTLLAAALVWLMHKHIEKMLSGLDNRITPLVWLFVFLLVLAVPLSMTKKGSSNTKYVSDNYSDITFSDEKRPNIILVIMDALTALDMQAYGYYRPTTPFITEWAKDAVVFKKAYSSSNWTSPAMMSMMTGQRPWTHRLWYRAFYNPAPDYEENMPALLKNNGYYVHSFVQNPYAYPEVLGIEDAFSAKDKSHSFWLPSGWWAEKIKLFFLNINRPVVGEWIFKTEPFTSMIAVFRPVVYTTLRPAEAVYNRFLNYIPQRQNGNVHQSSDSGKPFFAWLQVWPPHELYLPPEPYMGLFGDAGRFNSDRKQEGSGIVDGYKPEQQKTVDILRKRYDEFILYSDRQFELFMSRLSRTVDMSNTIIILTSDHGEIFSHGYMTHGGSHLYEPLVHVPLIIKMPGRTEGKIIDMPVEQIDIAPTILELAGITVPDWMEGRSLAPLIIDSAQSREGETIKPRPVFSMQLIRNRSFGRPVTKGTIAVWNEGYKLIYYLKDKKTLLFDLRSDPAETENLSEVMPAVRQSLLKLINDNLSRANAKIIQSAEK